MWKLCNNSQKISQKMFIFHLSSCVVTSREENKTCLPINCILPYSFLGVDLVVVVSASVLGIGKYSDLSIGIVSG